MEMVLSSLNHFEDNGSPFKSEEIQEWSRIDHLTGMLETTRIETGRWRAKNNSYGKMLDARERNSADGSVIQKAKRQVEIYQSQETGKSVQVVRASQWSSSRITQSTDKYIKSNSDDESSHISSDNSFIRDCQGRRSLQISPNISSIKINYGSRPQLQLQPQPQPRPNAVTIVNINNSNNLKDKKSIINAGDKKVGFCKTEVHFTADSGKVNIVETDGKPPPTNRFRRRKKSNDKKFNYSDLSSPKAVSQIISQKKPTNGVTTTIIKTHEPKIAFVEDNISILKKKNQNGSNEMKSLKRKKNQTVPVYVNVFNSSVNNKTPIYENYKVENNNENENKRSTVEKNKKSSGLIRFPTHKNQSKLNLTESKNRSKIKPIEVVYSTAVFNMKNEKSPQVAHVKRTSNKKNQKN